jgi:hypothetical protein
MSDIEDTELGACLDRLKRKDCQEMKDLAEGRSDRFP